MKVTSSNPDSALKKTNTKSSKYVKRVRNKIQEDIDESIKNVETISDDLLGTICSDNADIRRRIFFDEIPAKTCVYIRDSNVGVNGVYEICSIMKGKNPKVVLSHIIGKYKITYGKHSIMDTEEFRVCSAEEIDFFKKNNFSKQEFLQSGGKNKSFSPNSSNVKK